MKITVNNSLCKVDEATDEELKFLDKLLSYPIQNFRYNEVYMELYRQGKVDGREHLLRRKKFPTGLLYLVEREATGKNINLELSDQRVCPAARNNDIDISYLRDYQLESVEAAIPKVRGIIELPTASGKCLGIGTPVLKYDGSIVPVQDIKTGDLLMGPDSKPRKVLSTTKGTGNLTRINPIKGNSWVCNDVHVLTLVRTETGEIIDIPLNEYRRQAKWFKHLYKQFFTGVEFKPTKETLPIDPYFMGIWFGDGTKGIGKNGLNTVAISKPDKEIKNFLSSFCEKNNLRLNVTTYKDRCPTLRVCGKEFRQNHLLSLMRNVLGTKINIPKQYLTSSREDRLQFLAGLLDTDGYYDGKDTFEITQKRKDYARDIAFLARSLGFRAIERDKFVRNCGTYYKVSISGNCHLIPTKIKRKKAKPRKMNKNVTRTGFKVEDIGIGDFYGFELSGDGRFLLGDFTVTHNTVISTSIMQVLECKWVFLVHKKELLHQTAERFKEFTGEDVGLIGDGLWDGSKRITVATVQTLYSALKGNKDKKKKATTFINSIEGLIVDETHRVASSSYFKTTLQFNNAYYRYGLSGTALKRSDNKDMKTVGVIGPIIFNIKPQTLIDKGFLAKPKITMLRVEQYPEGYNWSTVREKMIVESSLRNRLVVREVERISKPCLVFVQLKNHGKILKNMILEKGFNVDFVWGDKDTSQRRAAIKALQRGELDVLIASKIFDEGIDIPSLSSVIIASGGKSHIDIIQKIGRGMRIVEGKTEFEAIDFYDQGQKWLAKHSIERKTSYEEKGYDVEVKDPEE